MKKGVRLLAWLLVVVLGACSSGSTATTATSGQAAVSTAVAVSSSSTPSQWGILSTSYAEALPVPAQLAIGTMKLEGTENVVAPEQAGQLLTLWQGYASLLAGETSAQAEYHGLQHQIEENMTSAQLQAIAGLQLTTQDMGSTRGGMDTGLSAATGGGLTGGTSRSTTRSTSSARTSGGSPDGGARPQGGGGEMMIFGGPPGMFSTQTADSSAAARVTNQATGDISSRLVQAILGYLRNKLAVSAAG